MSAPTHKSAEASTVQALERLLRSRSYEEIRQRMYDNPPGSPWQVACKTEIEIRNTERIAATLDETSRMSLKIRNSTEHMEKLTETLVGVTTDLSAIVHEVKESTRRMEFATYAIIGVTVVQLFYLSFLVFGKR
jgi:DNA repair exonuclease SbcCD ATPase subunit